jgi:hypothetical protein
LEPISATVITKLSPICEKVIKFFLYKEHKDFRDQAREGSKEVYQASEEGEKREWQESPALKRERPESPALRTGADRE